MSPIKKQLGYIKNSMSQILNGFVVFILASSGLGCALFLRYLNFNGTIISFVSLLVEFIGLILIYLIFKGYITRKESNQEEKSKKREFK